MILPFLSRWFKKPDKPVAAVAPPLAFPEAFADAVHRIHVVSEKLRRELEARMRRSGVKMDVDFVQRVMDLFADTDCHDTLWWRTDGEYYPIKFFVRCSDVMDWGCADMEDLTPENIGEAERAVDDCLTAISMADRGYTPPAAFDLFVCRQRKRRPMDCAYPDDERLWPLFDACGPPRVIGPSDPGNHSKRK